MEGRVVKAREDAGMEGWAAAVWETAAVAVLGRAAWGTAAKVEAEGVAWGMAGKAAKAGGAAVGYTLGRGKGSNESRTNHCGGSSAAPTARQVAARAEGAPIRCVPAERRGAAHL